MKKIALYLLLVAPIVAISGSRDEKEIKKSYTISGNASDFELMIDNVQGDVFVEGYDGNTIEMTLNIFVDAYNDKELSQAMEELELDEVMEDNILLLRMKAPFVRYTKKDGQIKGGGMHCEGPDYDYSYDFKLKVPREVFLHASTINNGRIRIQGVDKVQYSSNINGPISIQNVQETKEINTINGNIDISYETQPQMDSKFHTINGNITLKLPQGFAAEVEAESMQGSLFSAFDYEQMPAKVETTKGRDGRKSEYKLEQTTTVKIGKSSGPTFRFSTLNGDMFLKKF